MVKTPELGSNISGGNGGVVGPLLPDAGGRLSHQVQDSRVSSRRAMTDDELLRTSAAAAPPHFWAPDGEKVKAFFRLHLHLLPLKAWSGPAAGPGSVAGPSGGGGAVSAAWGKWRIDRGLCERLKLIGSTTVHLHRLPGKQQADVTVEVDLPSLGTLEPGRDRTKVRRANSSRPASRDDTSATSPQVNQVAQGASVGEGLLADVADCVAADRNREGPLAQEGLMPGRHGSKVVHHNKHLHHRFVGVE